jgi:hypothetical protein
LIRKKKGARDSGLPDASAFIYGAQGPNERALALCGIIPPALQILVKSQQLQAE